MSDVNPMPGDCGFADIIYEEVIRHCGYPQSILELGCGNGGNLARFIKAKDRHGIDPHFGNIKEAIGRYSRINFVLGDHNSLAFYKNNQFDVGFTLSVLDHIEYPILAIKEMLRVCRQTIFWEPYIKGESRQARKGETSHWKVTWYHNYLKRLKQIKTSTMFTINPLPLYKTNSGPLFHLIHVTSL